jgi:hypothetical protein
MAPVASPVQAALDLARLSQALADALEAGDLDAAEQLVADRTRVLSEALAGPWPVEPLDVSVLAEAQATVMAADRRSQAALARTMETTHADLGVLGHGARAMRAYFPVEAFAPGYVDRHD